MKEKMIPEIRFKGFTDTWEQRKFESLLDIKDGVRRGPFGSALKKEFFVESSDYVVYEQQNAIYDNYETRYNITKEKYEELSKFILSEGDFIMSGAGTIGRISQVPSGIKTGVFNQALIRFKINEELTDSEYFIQFIRADKMQKNLTSANPGSAITNLVPMSEVKKWDILVPIKEEQSKIGNFFKKLDETITLQERKVNLLKEQKKGYLQKMFPKQNEKFPELRFEGFTDAWEQIKLKDLGDTFTGLSGKTKEDFGHGQAKFVTYINVYTNTISDLLMTESVEIDEKQNQVKYGDVFFTTSSETPEEVGMSSVWLGNENNVYLNSFCFGYRPTSELEPYYAAFMLRSSEVRKKFMLLAQGISRYNISKTKAMEMFVPLPTFEEQQKIGVFFKSLDDTIALQERKLETLKELKKGYLQKMFA